MNYVKRYRGTVYRLICVVGMIEMPALIYADSSSNRNHREDNRVGRLVRRDLSPDA